MLLNGEFREDLYYRLKVIELTVPALRERRDEIPTLTDFFVSRFSRKYNRPLRPISDQLRQLFLHYDWPGNIRELENMIKRIVILQDEHLVVREIERNMERVAATAVAAGAPAFAAAGVSAGFGSVPGLPVPYTPIAPDPEPLALPDEPEPAVEEGGESLAAVAKAAAMKAERAAIEHTLRLVHWNRRQLQDAAQQDQGVRDQPRVVPSSTHPGCMRPEAPIDLDATATHPLLP
jgi:DNA-binding NtrC family response regulator